MMDKTESRFIKEYESSIPEPTISFKEVAAKSNIDLEKKKTSFFGIYRNLGIAFASIAVLTLAIVVPTAIYNNRKTIQPTTIQTFKEGAYSCVSFESKNNDFSLEGLIFTIEKNEEAQSHIGQIKTPDSSLKNHGLLITFTNTFLKECSFSEPNKIADDEFDYVIQEKDNLKLVFGCDHETSTTPLKITIVDTTTELGTLVSTATFQNN